MREISQIQLSEFVNHLSAKKFSYQEVFDELLDHYASAYEQSEKSVKEIIQELDQDFTQSKIEKIESRYLEDLKVKLRKSYFHLLAKRFKFPKIVVTILLVVLFWIATPYLARKEFISLTLFVVFSALPIFTGLFVYLKWGYKRALGKVKYRSAYSELVGFSFPLVVIYSQIPNLTKIIAGKNLIFDNPVIHSCFLFIGLIICSVSINMIRTNYKPVIQ